MPWYLKWFNEDYEKFYAHRDPEEAEKQVDFIIRSLKVKKNARVLDLGCGMGRHCFAFANRGYEVVGIDLSSYLIGKAREQLKQNPALSIQFELGPIEEIKAIGPFDLVINIFTSFGYYTCDADNANVFCAVRQYLSKGGKFFFDYLHPSEVKRGLIPYEERQIADETVEIHKNIEGDRIIKTMIFPGRTYREKVKLYCRKTIEEMLSHHRLRVIQVWNDYEGHPWKKNGDRQLFYCQAE